jgi:uncharacterized RmlC-like cupin family protein
MVHAKQELPLSLEAPGVTIRSANWSGMTALYVHMDPGADFTPVLKGLPDDLCSCPHWGYVLKGELRLRYKDGREEVARPGELWYTPPGHTALCYEETEFVEFSPEKECRDLLEHVRKQLLR